jgi:hypothetical protein
MAVATAANSLCNSQRAANEPVVKAWASSLHAAVGRGADNWVQSLATMANAKAKKLEEAAHRLRAVEWKSAIGVTSTARMPTKLAYRWVKGLTGWQQSPIGEAAANDGVPDIGEAEQEAYVDEAFAGIPAEVLARGKRRLPLCDQAVVEAEANKWAELWQEGKSCVLAYSLVELPPLHPLVPWALGQQLPHSLSGLGLEPTT